MFSIIHFVVHRNIGNLTDGAREKLIFGMNGKKAGGLGSGSLVRGAWCLVLGAWFQTLRNFAKPLLTLR